MAPVKRTLLLFTLLALTSLAVVLPAPAGAAVSCRNKVFNDWYADGKIASTHIYYDSMAFAMGLGLVPAPDSATA